MIRYLFIILVGLLSANTVLAQEEILGKVRVEIDFEAPLWVGQGARLSIEMLSTGAIFSGQHYAIPEVSGALVLQTSSNALNISEQENGITWQGLRYQIRIYPQRAGSFVVPSTQVSFAVSAGFGQVAQEFSFQSEEIRFDAQRPPGASSDSPIVTTSSLEISQQWEPEPVEFLVGHSVKRSVKLQAEDIPGMVLPPMPSFEVDGVGVYPVDPLVSSTADRGRFSGQRTDQIDLVFEQPGHYVIPGYVVQWWQPERQNLTLLEVEGLELDVAPNPALDSSGNELVADARDVGRFGWWLLFGILAGAAFWKVSPRIIAWLDDWRRRRENSEPAHFRRLAKACRANEPANADLLLTRWQSRANIPVDHLSPALQQELHVLQVAIASRNNSWDGKALLKELSVVRKLKLHARQQKEVLLPPLNPGPS